MNSLVLGSRRAGDGFPPYIIAEMACAHHGDPAKARAIVHAAAQAGADAVQLQFFSPEHLMSPLHPTYTLLEKLLLSREEWASVVDEVRTCALDLFVCAYDLPSLELAVAFDARGIKLNSSDMSNHDMLRATAATGLPFTVGTGASSLDEIADSMAFLRSLGAMDRVVLMHGKQNFPTELKDGGIQRIVMFRTLFPDVVIGYQDHTDGAHPLACSVDLVALGAGARVFEKHITLDRSLKETDYQASLEPDAFKAYVTAMADGALTLGEPWAMPLSEADHRYRSFQKKFAVMARDCSEGHILCPDDVVYLRTGDTSGLSPVKAEEAFGRSLLRSLRRGEVLREADYA